MIAYSARLRWDVHRGIVACDGVSVELHVRPAWVPWYEVDYVPGRVALRPSPRPSAKPPPQ
jgi:hypothetical protein